MIWLLLVPLLVLLPFLGDFLFLPGSTFSDLVISHFPNAFFLQQFIGEWHRIPLWSPQILSGYPIGANPLSGLLYPPGWLAVLLPAPLGFNLAVLIHLLIGGFGMYHWMRLEGVSTPGAVLAAVLFEGMAKIWGHLAAGHVTLIYAVCWTPWLLWAEKRSARSGRNRIDPFLPGLVLAVILLADPRWAAYSGLAWLLYALSLRLSMRGLFSVDGWSSKFREVVRWTAQTATPILGSVLLAGLLAAPLLMPLLEYTKLSTRASLSQSDSLIGSLPGERLVNLLLPDPGGPPEWTLYPTSVGLVFAGLAVSSARLRRRTGFWLGLGLFSLIFALGDAVPPVRWLVSLPGLNLLRVPPRALFLLGISLAAVAGFGLDAITSPSPKELGIGRLKPGLWVAGLAEVAWLLTGGFWFATREINPGFLTGAVAITAAAVLVLLRLHGKISALVVISGLLGVALLEPAVLNRMSFEPRSFAEVTGEAAQAAAYLKVQPGQFRVYSPSYSIPQQTAALYGLELADGVDPLQLRTYWNFMERATGVYSREYSVTIPAFQEGDPGLDNMDAQPDPRLLGYLNVKFVVSEFELKREGLTLQARFGETRIYRNEHARPRAWVELENSETPSSEPDIVSWRPDEIHIAADGPGRLILSEISYPGWQVRVDGKVERIDPFVDLLRSVRLGPGRHEVVFEFHSASLRDGAWISIITMFLAGILFLIEPVRRANGDRSL